MAGNGPELASGLAESETELNPYGIEGTMAVMLESCWPCNPTRYALDHAQLDHDAVWAAVLPR